MSSHGDLKRFAEALTVQGYTVRFTRTDSELTQSISSHGGPTTTPVAELEAAPDETDRQYYAAEMQELAGAGQDDIDLEAAERG